MANNKKSGINPMIAGAAGAVIGAGVAVAATKVMSDEKTREKMAEKASEIKDKVTELRVQAEKKAKALTTDQTPSKKRKTKRQK